MGGSLTDFSRGISEGFQDIASNAVGAVTNTVKGGYELGKGAVWAGNPEHWDEIGSAAGATYDFAKKNPGQTWDIGFEVGREMVKEQLKPENLITDAALFAVGVGAAGVATKVARSARLASEAADTAGTLTRAQRIANRVAQGTEKIDRVLSAPQRAQTRVMQSLPGGGSLTRWRGAQARKIVEWGGEGAGRHITNPIARSVAGGDMYGTAATGTTDFSRASWRLNKVQSLDPRNLSENVQVAGEVTKAIANPEDAARHLGKAAWEEYGDEAVGYGSKYAAKQVLTGGGDDKKRKDPATVDFAPTPTGAGYGTTWARPESFGTANTRASQRDTGQIYTVSNDTMPRAIGPSNWYGPTGGYDAGRGFSGNYGSEVEGI